MNRMNRIVALALSLALGISLLAGCGGGDSSTPAASNPAASSESASSGGASQETGIEPMDITGVTDPYAAVSGLERDTVVATVGGHDITAAELLYWVNTQAENYMSQLQYMGYMDTVVPWSDELEANLLNGALETAAFYRLLPVIGEELGLELTQEDLDFPAQDLALCVEELGSEETMTHWLWFRMMDEELYSQLYYGGRIFKMLQEHLFGEEGDLYPTDAEVKACIEDDLGYYRVKHILISARDSQTDEPLDDAAKAEKKAQAEDILAQLQQADDVVALFDELMHEYSEDPGLAAYPDGYEAYPGQMVPEFEQASLQLKDGEISGLVESDHGYHIILRLPLDLEKYRESVISIRMDEWIAGQLAIYGVETNEAYAGIQVAETHDKMLSLQATVQEELVAALQALQEKMQGEAAASSASGSQG